MPHNGFSGAFATQTLVFIWILKLKITVSAIQDALHVPIHQISALIARLEQLIEVMEGNVYRNVLSVMCQMKIVLTTTYASLMIPRRSNSTTLVNS